MSLNSAYDLNCSLNSMDVNDDIKEENLTSLHGSSGLCDVLPSKKLSWLRSMGESSELLAFEVLEGTMNDLFSFFTLDLTVRGV